MNEDQVTAIAARFLKQRCPSRAMQIAAIAKAIDLILDGQELTPLQIESELEDATAEQRGLLPVLESYSNMVSHCCEDELDEQIVAMRWANGESINGDTIHTQTIADQLGVTDRTIRNRLDKIQERYHELRGWPLPDSRKNYNTGR